MKQTIAGRKIDFIIDFCPKAGEELYDRHNERATICRAEYLTTSDTTTPNYDLYKVYCNMEYNLDCADRAADDSGAEIFIVAVEVPED